MKKLDLVILGATGYTGKCVVEKWLQIIEKNVNDPVRWAMSARSMDKLKTLVEELKQLGYDVASVPVIVCDANDEDSLKEMTRRTRVVMNCVGPYTIYGESIVKACIETGTHCLDMSAEINYMMDITNKYHTKAEEANVLIVSACGFGSLPCDMGVALMQQRCKGELNLIKSYIEIILPKWFYIPIGNHATLSYGTWESLICVIANFRDTMKKLSDDTPGLDKKSFVHIYNGSLWVPYPGPEEYIVKKGQQYLAKKRGKSPAQFQCYTTTKSTITKVILLIFIHVLYYLCGIPFMQKLVLKYPSLFGLGYFSRDRAAHGNKIKYRMTLLGYGKLKNQEQNKEMIQVEVTGDDPAVKSTCTSFVLSAVTLLKEHERMPRGGVLTTAAAFYDTDLIQSLNNGGDVNFKVIEK